MFNAISNARIWARLGLSRVRAQFGFMTAIAAWFAVILAILLGLPNAHWAGITVFTVTQLTRGLLLERVKWRLVGTCVGAAAGILLLSTFHDQPLALVIGIAVWLSLCAAYSAFLRHFRNYAVVLSGYTCAIVVLIDVTHPAMIGHLAYARVACTILGIIIATSVTYLFVPVAPRDPFMSRVADLTDQVMAWARAILGGEAQMSASDVQNASRAFLAELATIDNLADDALAGQAAADRRKYRLRVVLEALLHIITSVRAARLVLDPKFGADQEAADGAGFEYVQIIRHDLEESLKRLAAAHDDFRRPIRFDPGLKGRLSAAGWQRAALAFVRTGIAIPLIGLVWVLTDWSVGGFMLLGACIYVTVFATNERGKPNVRRVLPGVLCGIAGGMAYRLLLFPHGASIEAHVIGLLPFLFLSGLGLAMSVTAISAVEYNNFFLMMAQPDNLGPATGPLLQEGAALAVGVVLAVIVLHYVLPYDSKRNQDTIEAAFLRDLGRMTKAVRRGRTRIWQARLNYRAIDLLSSAVPQRLPEALQGSVAVLEIGHLIGRLQELPNQDRWLRRTLIEDTLTRLDGLKGLGESGANAKAAFTTIGKIADDLHGRALVLFQNMDYAVLK